MKYKTGDYISSKDGKLKIKNSKEKLIKLAEQEIKKWQEFIDRLKNNNEPKNI